MITLNHTHDVNKRSWLDSANTVGTDFPIQNLPIGIFRRTGTAEAFRGGVAIGDQVLDLVALHNCGLLEGLAASAVQTCAQSTLNAFMAQGPAAWQALRHAVFALMASDVSAEKIDRVRPCLIPLNKIEHQLPTVVGDYTDFYTSLNHALNVGNLVRPDDPLTPNFHWLPIAYHGRVSSLGVSGQAFHRPMGQSLTPGAAAPTYGPCARLDYELEIAIYIGQGNAAGKQIPLDSAEEHIFGIGLLNDWSARDIQFWEMAPLGPFLGKNFATTVSPWIVTMEALAPYRQPWTRSDDQPQPLPYLDSTHNREHGTLDIELEVSIETAKQRADHQPAVTLTRTSFRHQHWSVAQMVTQHTVGGCNLQIGDLFGSGTISGPTPEEAGSLVELTLGGRSPVRFENGEERGFLLDGDVVAMRGWCEKPGYARIGFGICAGEVLPATSPL